jgi:hypothetical protein
MIDDPHGARFTRDREVPCLPHGTSWCDGQCPQVDQDAMVARFAAALIYCVTTKRSIELAPGAE